MTSDFEGFNREEGILFLKQGIASGYRTQEKAKISPVIIIITASQNLQ